MASHLHKLFTFPLLQEISIAWLMYTISIQMSETFTERNFISTCILVLLVNMSLLWFYLNGIMDALCSSLLGNRQCSQCSYPSFLSGTLITVWAMLISFLKPSISDCFELMKNPWTDFCLKKKWAKTLTWWLNEQHQWLTLISIKCHHFLQGSLPRPLVYTFIVQVWAAARFCIM